MPTVELNEEEWRQLLNILGTTKEWPWVITNPLLMKIGQQLNKQTNSGEMPIASPQASVKPAN